MGRAHQTCLGSLSNGQLMAFVNIPFSNIKLLNIRANSIGKISDILRSRHKRTINATLS